MGKGNRHHHRQDRQLSNQLGHSHKVKRTAPAFTRPLPPSASSSQPHSSTLAPPQLPNGRPQEKVVRVNEETKTNKNGFRYSTHPIFNAEQLSSTWQKRIPVGPGLVNLGNTCFLNSVMQCLTYTPALANYFLQRNHERSCRAQNFCMLCELSRHITRALDGGRHGSAIQPKHILMRLRSIAKHMKWGRQEDAHEFLIYLLDAVQKSCLIGYPSKLDNRIKETTLIHQIFGGYLQSQIRCSNCKHESNTFDPMLDISLDIRNANSVEHAFKLYTKPELLTKSNRYRCEKCKKLVDAQKGMTIYRAPSTLIIQLKRFNFGHGILGGLGFGFGGGGGGKVNRPVEYLPSFDIRPFMARGRGDVAPYHLHGVLVHAGSTCNSGHYYAYIKSPQGRWYLMNDDEVQEVSLKQVLTQRAYMLFYSQEDKHTPTKQFNGTTAVVGKKRPSTEEDKPNGEIKSPKKAKLEEKETAERGAVAQSNGYPFANGPDRTVPTPFIPSKLVPESQRKTTPSPSPSASEVSDAGSASNPFQPIKKVSSTLRPFKAPDFTPDPNVVASARSKWVVSSIHTPRQSLLGSDSPATFSSMWNSDGRWTVRDIGSHEARVEGDEVVNHAIRHQSKMEQVWRVTEKVA